MSLTLGNIGSYDPAALYESLFKKIDSNSDGGIDKTEFTSALTDMASDQKVSEDEAAKMFTALDTDGNGSIDSSEMMKALKNAGENKRAQMPPPPPPDGNGPDFAKMAQDLVKSIDTSGDGSIDKSEFTAALSANQSSGSTDADTLFSKLDANGDGKVDESELSDALKSMRPPMPPPQGAGAGSDVSASTNGVSDSSKTAGLDRLLADLVNSLNSTSDTTGSSDDTASVSGQNSLFSDLVTSLKSSSNAESDLFSQLVEALKSSTGSSDDQISTLFSSLIDYMKNSSLYSQSGSVSYSTNNTESILSVLA